MRIEHYSDKYIQDIVEIIGNFHAEAVAEYDSSLGKNVLAETVISIGRENVDNVYLLIIDDKAEGILAGMEIRSLLNKKRIYQELIWYINEKYRGHGVGLLKYVQENLIAKGFDTIIMAVLENSKTDKIKGLYEWMGYRKFESHYIRDLQEKTN